MSNRVNWGHTKACESCVRANSSATACKHTRGGKTAREHADGTWAQRMTNQQTRQGWQSAPPGRRDKFPIHTCNGHRNKHVVA